MKKFLLLFLFIMVIMYIMDNTSIGNSMKEAVGIMDKDDVYENYGIKKSSSNSSSESNNLKSRKLSNECTTVIEKKSYTKDITVTIEGKNDKVTYMTQEIHYYSPTSNSDNMDYQINSEEFGLLLLNQIENVDGKVERIDDKNYIETVTVDFAAISESDRSYLTKEVYNNIYSVFDVRNESYDETISRIEEEGYTCS